MPTLIDLSHPLEHGQVSYPDDPGIEVVVQDTIKLVEGLANLDKLPAEFTFVGFPLNLTGRDGSPIRAVAVC